PRRAGAGRVHDPGRAGRRVQLAVHHPARPAPAGALMVSRALTTFTVGFLLLDALLLAYSGFALGRRMLVFWAAVCLVAAVLVVLWWRRAGRRHRDEPGQLGRRPGGRGRGDRRGGAGDRAGLGLRRHAPSGAPRPRRPRHGILPDQQRRGGGAARPGAGEAARADRG